MKEGQEKILYAAGDARERLEKLPAVTSALARGYDVLLCTMDIDEFMLQIMRVYHMAAVEAVDGHEAADERDIEFANVAAADLDLATQEEKAAAEEAAKGNEALLEAMKDALGDKVANVRISANVTDAPAVVVSDGPISLEMERVIRQSPEADMLPPIDRVLELNAKHPVFAKLAAAYAAGETERLALYTNLLYDQALLVAGLPVDDAIAFAKNICDLM